MPVYCHSKKTSVPEWLTGNFSPSYIIQKWGRGREKCSNVEEKTYEEINDSDEIVDEDSMQTGKNIGDEDDDGLEDFEDPLEIGKICRI